MTNHQKYINVVKVHENVGPRDTVEELQMEIDIPEFDDYYPESFEQLLPLFRHSLHPDYFPMVKSFSTSFFGQLVKVWYILKVFVKHDSWNEWGEGNFVEFPIKILRQPIEVVDLESSVLGINNGAEEI